MTPNTPSDLDSTPPPPSPVRLLLAEEPGFQSPPVGPPTSPPDPSVTTTSPMDPSMKAGPADEASSNGSGTDRADPSSKMTSDLGPLLGFTAKASSFAPLIAAVVQMGSIVVDRRRTPNTHAWMMRTEEAADIAAPLSRIAARHSPVKVTEETSDVLDGLEAVLATGTYGMRSYADEAAAAGAEQQAAVNHGDLGPGR